MKRTDRHNYSNKLLKRVVSFVTALVMFMGFFPLDDLPYGIKLPDLSLKVKAVRDFNEDPSIESYTDLIDYAEAYEQIPESHHENDRITIAIASGQSTDKMTGFRGIGTADRPFAGSVTIDATSFANFNIDTPFFNYVYDYAEIIVEGQSRNFTINTSGDNPGAVFADHVVHDNSGNVTYDPEDTSGKRIVSPASWTVQIEDYQSAPFDHSSLIGEMGADAEVTVSLVNNSTSPFSSATENVGAVCGIMRSGAKLTVGSITGSSANAVSSGTGNAGGLVGEMEQGSTLIVRSSLNSANVTAAHYAGGIAGKNDQATVSFVNTVPSILGQISGSDGAGGLFGYYKPIMTSNVYSLDLHNFSLGESASNRCKISGAGGAGGFFGVLVNTGGLISLSGSSSTTHFIKGTGTNTVFGGIIGKYQASSIEDTLSVSGTSSASKLTVNIDKSDNLAYYGGIVGKADGVCFVSISAVNVNAANSNDEFFGGAVACADAGYVYVSDFKLTAAGYCGGGVVGHTANGVVHLAGSTDLSAATSDESSADHGQIVGYRDNALVFADSSWDLNRYLDSSQHGKSADDIGSWGEVVRFKSSGFSIDDVLDKYYDASPGVTNKYHYATVKSAVLENGKIKLSGKASFATAALNMQLNAGDSGTDAVKVLRFADTTNCNYTALSQKSVVMTADIDLSNTGMTGLTRDNAAGTAGIGQEYAGSEFDGGGHTLTLAIGAGYNRTDNTVINDASGKGKIYFHCYNGLFGETTSDFTVKDLKITGKVHTYDRVADKGTFYVGTVAGLASGAFNASGVTVDSGTSIVYGTHSTKDVLYVGGLVGEMSDPGTSKIGSQSEYTGSTDSVFSASISGGAGAGTAYIGGVAGYVGKDGTISVTDIQISNSVINTGARDKQAIGGLFGVIEYGTNTIALNGVKLNALTVKGKLSNTGSMGGLLGYSWSGAAATFNNISILNCVLNNDNTAAKMAGLVYEGSGYWRFEKVEADGLTISGSAAASLGMLVNKAYTGADAAKKAMYLELPSGFTYKLKNVSAANAPTIYDEIAVYSKLAGTIEENGNSVISVNTNGTTNYGAMTASGDNTKVNMTSGSCNTYQNQVTAAGFSKTNPNSRYYYNVDNYKASAGTDAAKLYIYSVKQYAHSSIRGNFTYDPGRNFSGTLDMDGFSYYPFDVTENVKIKGSLTLHNEDIESMESAAGGDSSARSTLSATQHYLMHGGLFRNVSGSVTVDGSLSIDGTVPVVGNYCGALICGSIGGTSSKSASFDSSGGSISLAGIEIYNKNAAYSPLLINKSGGNAVLKVYNVSATGYNSGDQIATSLIGMIGSDTAEKIQLTFNNIKLDAREAESTLSALTQVYGTTRSLFTKATLLHSLTYSSGSGSFGVYNYEYSEDWQAANNHVGNVTYGKELSDPNSKNFKKEFWYYLQNHSNSSAHYVDPDSGSLVGNSDTSSYYDFTGFLPYVSVWGTGIGNSTTMHQLDVNNEAATFSGCGTYNDPYTITDGDQIEAISKILANNDQENFVLCYPNGTDPNWCAGKTDHEKFIFHKKSFKTREGNTITPSSGQYYLMESYTENGETKYGVTDASSGTTLPANTVRSHLAGAYYYLENDIVIDDQNFAGLGNSNIDNNAYVFRGVIAGNEKTITITKGVPLIYASNGCVIRKLKVQVGTSAAPVSVSLSGTSSNKFASSGGCGAYGAVIGRVMGGDNIINEVTVDVSNVTVTPTALTPVGGYIGVIVNGGVFFRNMDKVNDLTGFGTTGLFASDNMSYLYCNPLIGRVINGFAVNERGTYAPYENGSRKFGDSSEVSGTQVMLQNSNKNYSITDIDSSLGKLSVSGTTVEVPNSQAFFIMSLIINSGMGATSVSSLGYYGTYNITRHADYSFVGTNLPITDTTSVAYLDYNDSLIDDNRSPYLISEYATGSAVNTLGSGAGFNVTVSDDIVLPDGYKGIGNLYNNNDSFRLALSSFDGGGKTISQNTTYYSYTSGNDNYLPYTGTVHGIGLFNYINNATFSDCILKGNVITRQYLSGSVLNYTQSQDYTALAAGGLVGTLNMAGATATIEDVYLKNISVESTRDAAGMIGYLINDGKSISITNAASTATSDTKQSSDIYINAGTNAAGMIARQGKDLAAPSNGRGDITIDLNGHYFNFTSIISRYEGGFETDKWNSDWALGVGGLVGIARGNDSKISGTANSISISNVKIGSATGDTLRTVACQRNVNNTTTYGNIYVGGLVGVFNRCPVSISNCEIYNVNVASKKYSGGMVGWGGTASEITIDNCNLYNSLSAKVYSSSDNAGGVVGFCKDDMGKFTVRNSIIEGYTIEGAYSGGALGNWQATSNAFALVNSVIDKCTVKYTVSGGGIAGQLKKNLYGYNVRVSDITFTTSSTVQQGYICGKRDGGIIKIAGFLRSGNITEAKLVGSATANAQTNRYSVTDLYGSGGYVFFADFNGTFTNTSGSSPYVTINPDITFDSNIGKLTGDGISSDAVTNILSDSSNKKYTVADLSYFINSGTSSIKTDIVSSFSTELGGIIGNNGYDFPMLIVNNTNTADEVVNNYLRMLTNTDSNIDFSRTNKTVNGSSNIGSVTIKKCTYNKNTGLFTVGTSDVCLQLVTDSQDSNNMNFKIGTKNGQELHDTDIQSGQFTLIDVAFKDPTTTSSPAVVYHLYVPVMVKKLVEYRFDISVLSGTSYDRSLYGNETDGIRGNPLLENLGSPVTFEFEYSYLRTASEWAMEDVDYSYQKKLTFTNTGNYEFGSDTKAVLIDLNRGGVPYYLDNWNNGFHWNDANDHTKGGYLDLNDFADANGTNFSPQTFEDMISDYGITGSECLTERYYLTVYTTPYNRAENDTSKQLAHYTVASAPLTETAAHPSRKLDCQNPLHSSVHLIIGDFYTNDFSVRTENTIRKMSASNKEITVTLNSEISIVNQETKDAIKRYLDYRNITLYQSFLIAFEKYLAGHVKSETGISAIDECSVQFSISGGSTPLSVTQSNIDISKNFIELQNNVDLSSYVNKNASVTIAATAVMRFNDEETRNAQFPKAADADVGVGALVVGHSNISSKKENTAHSAISKSKQDSQSLYYYRTSEQEAALQYYADYSGATKENQRESQLGINGREIELDNKTDSKIYTEVRYDASELLNNDDLQYIKCNVKLCRKNANGEYEPVAINKYLSSLTVNGMKQCLYTTYAANSQSSEFFYVYSKENVDQFPKERNVFRIPIVFEAFTGNLTNFRDQSDYIYANYKMEVTVSAFDSDDSSNNWTDFMIHSRPESDFVIYTNARVFTELIKNTSN